MASLATLAQPVETARSSTDPLDQDRIDYEAWLLPPETLGRLERTIRFCSMASGPVAFGVALACVVGWIL